MTDTVSVALAQIDIASLDVEKNRRRILDIAEKEAGTGANLVVFPELALTGYVEPMAPGDEVSNGMAFPAFMQSFNNIAEDVTGATLSSLTKIAKAHSAFFVIGMALKNKNLAGSLSNASVLVGPDGVLAVYEKVHLWQYEKLFFKSGNGFPVTSTPFGRLGMQVCYDIRFPEATRCLMLQGAEIVTNIWASFRHSDVPAEDENQFVHRAFTRAQENGVYFLSCNRVGRQGRYTFLGNSVICAPNGQVIASVKGEEEAILRAELPMSAISRYRDELNLIDDRKPSAYDPLTIIHAASQTEED